MDHQCSFSQPATAVAIRQHRSVIYHLIWRHLYWRLRKRKCLLLLIWAIGVSFTIVAVTRLHPRNVQQEQDLDPEITPDEESLTHEAVWEDTTNAAISHIDHGTEETKDASSIILALKDLIKHRKHAARDHKSEDTKSNSQEQSSYSWQPTPERDKSQPVTEFRLRDKVHGKNKLHRKMKSTEEILKTKYYLQQRSKSKNNEVTKTVVLNKNIDPSYSQAFSKDKPANGGVLKFKPAKKEGKASYKGIPNCPLPPSLSRDSSSLDSRRSLAEHMLHALLYMATANNPADLRELPSKSASTHSVTASSGADTTQPVEGHIEPALDLLEKHLTADQQACAELYLDYYLQEYSRYHMMRQLSRADRDFFSVLHKKLRERLARYH